jgi:hypothetical protein
VIEEAPMTTWTRLAAFALASLLAAAARAAPNEGVFSYSGYLRTAGGAAETAPQSIAFTLYDAATGGAVIWTQTVTVTPDSEGWFCAVLSHDAGLVAGLESQLWLGIKVGGEAEMAPRTKLGASLWALAVDWGGVQNRPAACPSGQFLSGYDPATGAALCATPSGGGGGVTSVAGSGVIAASPTTGAVTVSLSGCASANQILQWSGSAWSCIPTPSGGGGGVTAVTASAPLTSTGGASPNLAIASCASGQVLKYNGSSWACAADANSGGTVTSVSGTGPISVAGGTTTPSISIATASATATGALSASDWTAFSLKQARVTGSCGAGMYMNIINADGSVSCWYLPVFARGQSFATTYLGSSCTGYENGTVTITAPAAGIIEVEASVVVAFIRGATAADDAHVYIGSSATDCSDNFGQAAFILPSGYPVGQILTSGAPRNAFTVTGPGTYTLYLNGISNAAAPNQVAIWAARLSAVWHP